MFQHWLKPTVRPGAAPGIFARIAAGIKPAIPFLHITTGVVFLAWGLEALLPVSTWRLVAGLYILSWTGWRFLGVLFKEGIYMLDSTDQGND